MKIGIVCEGGGTRGVYTNGVLQAFLDGEFMADELVGVSAGATGGASYVSQQSGRGWRTSVEDSRDPRYASFKNWARNGSLFSFEYLFHEIPKKDPLDFAAFAASPCDYYAGATDIATGQPVFFGKEHIKPGFVVLRASCSLPMFAPIVPYEGRNYLDGGIAAPIPMDKALQDGCERLVVILTRERGYRKAPQKGMALVRRKYARWPALVNAIEQRYLVYNAALEQLAALEAEGRALVIAPARPLPVDRFGRDYEKVVESYHIGEADGAAALQVLAAWRALP